MKFLAIFFLSLTVNANELTLEFVSYNVENLFDTEHDEGKKDWSYLPMAFKKKDKATQDYCASLKNPYYRKTCLELDWSKELVELKMQQLKKAIMTDRDSLPDFLALSEVENEKILGQFAKVLGYSKFLMTKSPDKRGIDVALLWKEHPDVIFKSYQELEIQGDYFKKKPTRNILEVFFKVRGEGLSLFVNHWPSQGNPSETRVLTARRLKKRLNHLNFWKGGRHFIVMGDFNTLPTDHPHPFHDVLFKTDANKLVDTYDLYRRGLDRRGKEALALGTHFYPPKFEWSRLDRIFVSSNLIDKKGPEVLIKSFKIHRDGLTKTYEYNKPGSFLDGNRVYQVPKRMNPKAKTSNGFGFSDHFPVSVKLKFP